MKLIMILISIFYAFSASGKTYNYQYKLEDLSDDVFEIDLDYCNDSDDSIDISFQSRESFKVDYEILWDDFDCARYLDIWLPENLDSSKSYQFTIHINHWDGINTYIISIVNESQLPDTDPTPSPSTELWPNEANLHEITICGEQPCNQSILNYLDELIRMDYGTFFVYSSNLSEQLGDFELKNEDGKRTFKYNGELKLTFKEGEWSARKGYLAFRDVDNKEAYYFSLTEINGESGFTGSVDVIYNDGIAPQTIRLR